ncbi:cysteine hydrolase family protein [Kiloniella laminariae]|uniref:Cysteine hydrolase family protein n=1 Tax=Kiloniella laminariae TaxID=454162 RepID=A0ABT4LLJ4_9PROT|nr:cysteine hydrolase family protein [Kiloniella laminariae]MCZ4281974.1 cysteine hydrolase family protein [Kiloniella laminariae]
MTDTTDTPPPVLLLIDWQKGFRDWDYWGGNRNNPAAEQHAAALLDHWRAKGWPVAHALHHSLSPDSLLRQEKPSGAIIPELAPFGEEAVFVKRQNSAFVGTDLDGFLRRAQAPQLVIAGLTTNHCVSTTVRMAGNMDYKVRLVGDACATFDRTGPDGTLYEAALVHAMSLSDLHNEFCQVVATKDLLTP